MPELAPEEFAPAIEVATNIEPEGNKKVENEWRPQRSKRNIDEVEPHRGRGDAHLFAEITTYAKGRAFEQVFELLHIVGYLSADNQ